MKIRFRIVGWLFVLYLFGMIWQVGVLANDEPLHIAVGQVDFVHDQAKSGDYNGPIAQLTYKP